VATLSLKLSQPALTLSTSVAEWTEKTLKTVVVISALRVEILRTYEFLQYLVLNKVIKDLRQILWHQE
jgi:hypothetical protein